MIETILARASLYNFLAAIFGDPPTLEMLASVREMLPEVEPAPLVELHKAYTRLLVGPGAGYAPPYASVYLDLPSKGKPLLWGREAALVESQYQAAGLDIAPGQNRIPDHLAFELQFMQHLCSRQAEALGRGQPDEADEWDNRQRTFLNDHVWPWLPRFAERVTEAEAHPFYRALVELTVSFIDSEIMLPEGVESFGR